MGFSADLLHAREAEQLRERPGPRGRIRQGSFAVVTMTNGQVLYGAIGCEVMLRVGTASVVSPSSPGLIDSTGGTTLDNGAGLTKNHLYMMTISDRGVKATAATTKLLVRGTYEASGSDEEPAVPAAATEIERIVRLASRSVKSRVSA